MKKKILLGLLFIILITNKTYSQYYCVDTTKLNSAFRELANNPNTPERQRAFFVAFPNTWMEFITTYQYCNKKKYDLTMYRLASKHIEALGGRVTLIKDSIYCKKLVNIAIGGSWDADAPSYIQQLLHQVMWKKMDSMLKSISQLRKGNQMQFWQFYWSNIVKSKELEIEFNRLHKLNADVYPKEMKIMSIAFDHFYDGIAIPKE